ncbi:MAG: HD domain-containing protein [Nanoarchaeota archaeon]|nr:HD domain-containing protein [Nanoarchaeota archaeon]MBU1445577.1 HD domain-containing protein [Nanoarchaeota archaeon]MBU2420742.1 HD domain-containing protein [Nanoarchaeota archaeon]MBU2475466.1 HD domain-containing protein [Nanoarchaeota archaeon]
MASLGKFQKEFNKLDFDLKIHSLMLIDISKEIAAKPNKKLDKDKLIACAILHDSKNHDKNHEITSAKYAKRFLEKEGFSNKFIADVYNAILNHEIKPKTKDFTIACFYDADILCRFYAFGILRAWNNIKIGNKKDWKKLFKKIIQKKRLDKYLQQMEKKLQLKESKKLLFLKKEEYLLSHKLLEKIIF